MAATILIGAGADVNLLSNAGWPALRFAERRVALDAQPPAAGTAAPTAAQRLEHRRLLTVLRGFTMTAA